MGHSPKVRQQLSKALPLTAAAQPQLRRPTWRTALMDSSWVP